MTVKLLIAAGLSIAYVNAQGTNLTNLTNPLQEDQAALIPWSWYVNPDIPNYACPSVSSTLGTFAIINLLVCFCNLFLGNRLFLAHFTGGWLGKPTGKTWWYMFIFPLAIHFGANAAIAILYKLTPGYATGFRIGELTLFYTTRPRLGWIMLAFLMRIGKTAGHYPYQESENGYYEASAKGAMLAEMVLLLISSYYTGWTAHFAATHGYYILGTLSGPHAHDAQIMYSGALLSLISLFSALVRLVTEVISEFRPDHEASSEESIGSIGSIILVMATSWLGSWLFWAGYVRLAADLYCPPKLVETGVIWTIFSAISSTISGGF